MRILVIKLSALGDVILAFPAFARLRAFHPDAYITLLTTPPFEGLTRKSGLFDDVETDGRPASVRGWLGLMRRLRHARYDRVYDLQTNDRTQLIFQLLRPSPPVWSGTALGCALPHPNPGWARQHALERHAEQLNAAGVSPRAPSAPGAAPGPDLAWAARLATPMPRASFDVLLAPGSSPRHPAKRWPADRFGALAAALAERGLRVAIVGGASERPLAAAVRAAAPAAVDLTGRTDLVTLAALGAGARLVVGGDTGPVHLASAAGAPAVVLFSAASDPARNAPRGRVEVLSRADLATLSAETVLEAAIRRLECG